MSDEEWDDAARSAYQDAYRHAREIVDVDRFRMQSGYWASRRVPVEREAMIGAIAARMRIGPKMGSRHVDPAVIREAVDAALEDRPPAF